MVLPALEELPREIAWTLGGGTGLALSLKHRISYDIDIFFEHAGALKLLSPFKNKKIRELSDNFQQPGYYLKIERPEGDIDFLVTRSFAESPFFFHQFRGKPIRVESPAEIISKKIHYRGSRFTVRDIFDMAAFSVFDQPEAADWSPEILADVPRTLNRIELLEKRYEETVGDAVNATVRGEPLVRDGFALAVEFLRKRM